MTRIKLLVVSFALAASVLSAAVPAQAEGRTHVTWTRIDVPESDGSAHLAKTLKKLLNRAAKKTSFGKTKKLSLAIKVTSFKSEKSGDVHRVSCTIVGRIPGGPSAKSHISFGGHPKDKAKLEKQVLTMVANGVVTRLAQIVRARAKKEADKQKAEKNDTDE